MLDANSAEFAARVDSLTKRLNGFINLTEDNAAILIAVLMRQLCVTVASETCYRNPREVRVEMARSLRQNLAEAQHLMALHLSTLHKPNDQ
jgi:hypothetical protein